MQEIKRYFSYIGKYKGTYWAIFISTIISSMLLSLLYSYMNKFIFNSIEYKNGKMFMWAIIFCLLLLALNSAYPYFRYFQIRVVRKIVFDIKLRLFEKLLKMDISFFESNHSGEALKILNQDANSLKDSYFSHVYWLIGSFSDGLVSITAMLVFSPILGLVSLVFCFITTFISVRVNKEIKLSDKSIQAGIGKLTARMVDMLDGFLILKMYPGAKIIKEDYEKNNDMIFADEKQRANIVSVLSMVTFLLSILANFGTIAVGAYMVHLGKMDYGTVMAIVSLQMGASQFMKNFAKNISVASSSLVKAGRVFDFLEMDGEERNTINATQNKTDNVAIAVENLNFSYGANKVLKNFNLTVNKNEKLIIMGESGCGKSTLIKLLMGFYKADGEIFINGNELSKYSLEELRKVITYMPQESYLFEGTIKENIAFGQEETVSDEAIREAAAFAYADEFINELPKGYDEKIEAGGSNLSGGQRQRIAIARAFLRNSPIILMDEPASALDAKSEQMVNKAIKKLMAEKTVIMVSHQDSIKDYFDRVIVMEN